MGKFKTLSCQVSKEKVENVNLCDFNGFLIYFGCDIYPISFVNIKTFEDKIAILETKTVLS